MELFQSILKRLPKFKGKLRIIKLFLRNKNHPRIFTTKTGVKYILPNLIENVSLELFVNGIYERETIDYIIKNVPENGVFIDVGANIGAISIDVALKRPDIKIYGFEASKKVFNYLKQNKEFNNCTNLEIYNFAVHEREGETLDFYSPEELNGKGSFSAVYTKESERVITKNLDIFLQENKITPNIIKIDVEGYELTVLKSLNQFLKINDNDCRILFEFVDWAEISAGFECGEAQTLLLNLGYKMYSFPELVKMEKVQLTGGNNILATKPF
jgi:FkbM family methyltransferase